MKWVEAVPNLSFGKEPLQIQEIQNRLEQIPELWILGLEENADAHRTVFTLVGSLEGMEKGLLALFEFAVEYIDMSEHEGEHLRVGAVDVCPLIPLGKTTIQEAHDLAFRLAKNIWENHNIPVSFYQMSTQSSDRKLLKHHRIGQYEGLQERFLKGYLPDVGDAEFNINSGLTVMGVRDFLIAYNINLKDTTLKKAQEIARKLRQNRDKEPPTLPNVHMMAWHLPQQDLVQISCNLPHYQECSMEDVFCEVKKISQEFGVEVAGSELIGLAPLGAFLPAPSPKPEQLMQQLQEKVQQLGLGDLKPFDFADKVLEFKIKEVTGYEFDN